MLGAVTRPSPTTRSAIAIAAAVALILPLPARCLGCSRGEADCTRCHATHSSTTQPTHRNCCQHQAEANRIAPLAADCPNHVQSKTCGCKIQVPERAYVAGERQSVPTDLVAILPAAQPLLAADPGHAACVFAPYGNLPPPVPHRILHCSWII